MKDGEINRLKSGFIKIIDFLRVQHWLLQVLHKADQNRSLQRLLNPLVPDAH